MTDAPGRRVVPLSPMRSAIARRMTQSKQHAPHIYLTAEAGIDDALSVLDRLNAGRPREERITLTALLVRALVLTLPEEPALNAWWTDAGPELIDEPTIGVAIALDDGLIAPALVDSAERDLAGLADALRDLTTRARAGRLRSREMTEATFTLTNLGMFPITQFAAIINPPQVGILAVGRGEPRPRVVDGTVAVRTMTTMTLSADHRAVDGAVGARFLGRLKARLEVPTWAG
ncbi:MAG TPA: dihydrolipoamide acetyltransferase family protein [Candidatus Limnocylindrales bacterium]|nr:dihydrolipoamide acetyltransferase family protein [Candidatus Limnocylindrales bacterium]